MKAASISVAEDLYKAMQERAGEHGMAVHEWASTVLAERVRLERQTDSFFDRRAAGASPRRLGELLDKAPDVAPEPWDELQ